MEIAQEEIIILKNGQYTNIGYNTNRQPGLSLWPFGFGDDYRSDIINDNGKRQDEDVQGDKGHIKDTTGGQQKQPAKPVW